MDVLILYSSHPHPLVVFHSPRYYRIAATQRHRPTPRTLLCNYKDHTGIIMREILFTRGRRWKTEREIINFSIVYIEKFAPPDAYHSVSSGHSSDHSWVLVARNDSEKSRTWVTTQKREMADVERFTSDGEGHCRVINGFDYPDTTTGPITSSFYEMGATRWPRSPLCSQYCFELNLITTAMTAHCVIVPW